jgi:uncharacterized protein (TIGR02246 family)
MKRHFAVVALIACAFFAVTRNQAASPDAAAKAIRHNEELWNKDFESKDPARLLAHYADDATLMSPGMPAAHGKDAIGKVLKEMVNDPALTLKFQASRVEVSKSADIGYSEGSYTMTMTNPATKKVINDKGSYVTVYRKQADGSWKAVSDIATSEVPPSN